MSTVLIIVAVALVVVLAVWSYNKLVKLRVRVDEAEAGIDVALKRRADLIPNLVETVKGYASHESQTFQSVTDARAKTLAANTVNEKAAADAQTSRALTNLMATAEDYPQLRAVESFVSLQEELTSTENRIAFSRQNYNANVSALNAGVSTFPYMLFAGLAKARTREFWELDDPAARTAPTVSF